MLNIFQQITGYVVHVNQKQIVLVNDGIALADRCGESIYKETFNLDMLFFVVFCTREPTIML